MLCSPMKAYRPRKAIRQLCACAGTIIRRSGASKRVDDVHSRCRRDLSICIRP